MDVRQVVARRGDLSTFVVHLTRDVKGRSATEALRSILGSRVIRAGQPMGHAISCLNKGGHATESQKVVCFTETPLEYVYLMLEEIDGREVRLKPYGVALTKRVARQKGVNPVWYVDITPGHDWISKSINQIVEEAIQSGRFGKKPIAKIAPFIEQMGSKADEQGRYEYRKEFGWAREWRYLGDFKLPERLIVLCPANEFGDMAKTCNQANLMASFIDPAWGLERIIASLAGFDLTDIEIL
jgi:hypothetical protein